jgi:hypothetical protein
MKQNSFETSNPAVYAQLNTRPVDHKNERKQDHEQVKYFQVFG